jgi:hypothetical protein
MDPHAQIGEEAGAVGKRQKKTRPKALFYRYRVISIRCAVAASARAKDLILPRLDREMARICTSCLFCGLKLAQSLGVVIRFFCIFATVE